MMGNCCKHVKFDRNQLSLRRNKKIVLLLVGLDNAGKTSAAKSLIGDSLESVVPTVGFSTVTLQHRGCNVVIYDLGGGSQIRGIWQRYFADVHGVIFVVDASDEARLHECGSVLEELLTNDKLAGKPVLLLANKQDNEGALDELDVVERLGLEALVNRQRCPTMVETCSTRLDNKHLDPAIRNGFAWLASNIVQDYALLNARVESDMARQKILDEEVRRERREKGRKLRQQRADKAEDESVITVDPFQPITELTKKNQPIKKPSINDQPIKKTSINNQPVKKPSIIKDQSVNKASVIDHKASMNAEPTVEGVETKPRIILVQESPRRFDLTGTEPRSLEASTLSARVFSGGNQDEVQTLNDRNTNLTDYVKGQLELQKVHKRRNPLRRLNKTQPVDSDSDSNSLHAGDPIRSRPLSPLTLTPRTLTPLPRKPGALPPLRVTSDPFIVRPSSQALSQDSSAWGLDKPLDAISTNQRTPDLNAANQLADISSDSEDVIVC